MFAALLRRLRGEESATATSHVVTLADIWTWADLYNNNKQEFQELLIAIDTSLEYAEDPDINQKVSICGANMTFLAIDGIVRSTDTTLTSTEGISGAISDAAGPRLDEALTNLEGCQEGEAKTTSGFNLPAKYIVHTVGPAHEQPDILESCYKNSLTQMTMQNMKSLAFCCISNGNQGYPNDKAVLVALKTVRDWLVSMKTANKLDEVDRIIFCLFCEEDVFLYSTWMQIFFPSTCEPSSIKSQEETEEQLRPLPGFIELTTEPDMITFEDKTNTMRAKMPCGHIMGRASMAKYFQQIVKDGKFKFVCPAYKCDREWPYFLVRHVACLSCEQTQEFEKKLTDNFLNKENGRQMCLGCKTWCLKASGVGNRVRCPICTVDKGKKFTFCWVCLGEWKSFRFSRTCGNSGCDGKGNRNSILGNCPTKLINLTFRCPIIRACPGCRLLIHHQVWRWLWGEETTTRNVVKLADIPTWTDLYKENKQEFVDTLSGINESIKYVEDPEINNKVSIYGADMTCLEVDGIVRSTDTSLTSKDGISGAIRRAAGSNLDTALKTLGGCDPGEAKTSSGFNLPATYIVHTVGTRQEQPEILERCYKSCLEQMRLNNMKSLAFCCISTGLHGYPIDKAVHVALKTVRIWLQELKSQNKLDEIDRIIFCHFSNEDEMMYTIWMQIYFPSTCEPEANPVSPTPEEAEVVAIWSSLNSDSFEEGMIEPEEEEQKQLRPLPGFIQLTTEPDMITFDDDPDTERAKMPCGHVIGPESMTIYARDILTKGKFRFVCPSGGCNSEWDYFLVRHVAFLSRSEMRQFEKKLEHNFIDKEKGNQRCPGCQTWCMRVDGAGNRVRCPICTAEKGKKYDFCWICQSEWKRFWSSGSCGNRGCNGEDQRIHILANCHTKKINYCDNCPAIRGCPNCGILIEHRDKCAHVSCSSCHTGFCFICLKEMLNGNWQCKPYFGKCNLKPRQTSLPGSR